MLPPSLTDNVIDVATFGLLFSYHARISRQFQALRYMELADNVDLGLPYARGRVLSALLKGWETIRLTSSFLCIG